MKWILAVAGPVVAGAVKLEQAYPPLPTMFNSSKAACASCMRFNRPTVRTPCETALPIKNGCRVSTCDFERKAPAPDLPGVEDNIPMPPDPRFKNVFCFTTDPVGWYEPCNTAFNAAWQMCNAKFAKGNDVKVCSAAVFDGLPDGDHYKQCCLDLVAFRDCLGEGMDMMIIGTVAQGLDPLKDAWDNTDISGELHNKYLERADYNMRRLHAYCEMPPEGQD